MKQIQLTDLVEIKHPSPLRSLSKRYTGEKVSEPFHIIKRQDINEFGFIRATETSSSVRLSERDLNYLSSRDRFLKPYDILISIKYAETQPGIILDASSPKFIASPIFTILRTRDQQLREELSFSIFSFFHSKNGEEVFHDIRNIPVGRRSLLSRVLIPVLEGDERKTLVNNVKQQIQKCKEIEKIKMEIDQIREKNGFIMSGNDKKQQYGA